MNNSPKLLDIFTDLHKYDCRLKTEFQAEVAQELPTCAKRLATPMQLPELAKLAKNASDGELTSLLPGTLLDENRELQLLDHPALAELVINATCEAEAIVRENHSDPCTPHEKSRAWSSGARWISRKFGTELVASREQLEKAIEQHLPVLCDELLNERRVAGSDSASCTTESDWTDAIAKQRKASDIVREIQELDTPENVADLLEFLWTGHGGEASAIPLPRPIAEYTAPEPSVGGYFSCRDIVSKFSIPTDRQPTLEARLSRFRKKDMF